MERQNSDKNIPENFHHCTFILVREITQVYFLLSNFFCKHKAHLKIKV